MHFYCLDLNVFYFSIINLRANMLVDRLNFESTVQISNYVKTIHDLHYRWMGGNDNPTMVARNR